METGNGIILRLVNYNSKENDFEVSTPWTIKEVVETDLLENPVKNTDRKLTFSEGAIYGRIRANEIVTLRVFASINGK
jgi:tRNA threonylcarbamoyladenosine modification (KEOPS) complex  Pcc1 subunit